MASFLRKAKQELEDLPENLSQLGVTVSSTFNPNHRHNEAFEIENDKILQEIRASHRFDSFARERDGNLVKWYVDAKDYMHAVSELLDSARECIFIQDWWLSPELYLRRTPGDHEEWRLDRILKRKAEEGVHIYIIVYKEVAIQATLDSAHTKHYLEELHSNIAVIRHPDHFEGESVMYWSHHQKVVLVDNVTACVGGLDLCYGRWDTHDHMLADVHIRDFYRQTIWPGQDFNNSRVQDFQDVSHWISNQQSRLEVPRMPWHDVHMMMVGPACRDVSQHFCERWNFIRDLKYKHKGARYPVLSFPHFATDNDDPSSPDYEPILRHPHLHKWKEQGRDYMLHFKRPEEGGVSPFGGPGPKGEMKVQVVRSCGDWSNGTLTEHSIMNAYVELIRESNHYIYIENQFFVSNASAGDGQYVHNRIARALAERIIDAAKADRPFKIVVVIPAIPAFAGDLGDPSVSASTNAILDAQYKTICRGKTSIFEVVKEAGYDASKYISFFNLRSYDRINYEADWIKKMEESGVTFYEAQAALGRLYLGADATTSELEANKIVKFKLAQQGESTEGKPNLKAKEGGMIEVQMPESLDEARDLVERFQRRAPREDEQVSDSVAPCSQNGGEVSQQTWMGSEETEKAAFVTEILYPHSKLMIVDDRRVIMGSANLNDRSMLGDRDSEIALVVEDEEQVETTMNGQNFYVTKFASTLRRQLYKEHLGLLPPGPSLLSPPSQPNPSMRPVGHPHDPITDEETDRFVSDPMGEELVGMWEGRARVNVECFGEVFHCVPAKGITTWEEYKRYVPHAPNKVGHIASQDMDLSFIQEKLGQIKGHLVEMPLDFISKDRLWEEGTTVNPITMPIFV